MARSGALNVYIEQSSSRTEWIFQLLLEDLLGAEVVFMDAPVAGETMLNYAGSTLDGAINIKPFGLLAEKGVSKQKIEMGEYDKIPVFFLTEGSDLPFDPFSMSFYLVSRYEEYLPFKADVHGRFPHTESLAFKENFLHLAVVNRCAIWIEKLLKEKFPSLEINTPSYSFQPTIDVDQAFAPRGLGFKRSWGGLAKLILSGKLKEAKDRLSIMNGSLKDPYDNFGIISAVFSGLEPDPIYFILAGKTGKNDRNLSLKNELFASLVKELSDKAKIAIHPSYGAGNNVERIRLEVRGLEKVCEREINCSRQHFVKMTFPDTYEALIQAGITDDYTMGFASISGFRAGIASPFKFYNLEKEEVRPLRIHPFMFMDSTLSDYMHLEPVDYYDAVLPFIEEVKHVQGTLCGIWHNYDLADSKAKHKALKMIVEKAKS